MYLDTENRTSTHCITTAKGISHVDSASSGRQREAASSLCAAVFLSELHCTFSLRTTCKMRWESLIRPFHFESWKPVKLNSIAVVLLNFSQQLVQRWNLTPAFCGLLNITFT